MGSLAEVGEGNLLSVPGLSGAAVRCGIKPSGNLDLALLRCDPPARAAAVFTRNRLPAAPVVLGRETLNSAAQLRSFVINSGNANAMTGARGLGDARQMASLCEAACGGPSLVFSTGVIGVPLPMDRIARGIAEAAGKLGTGASRGAEVAEAILTTDTFSKTGALSFDLPPRDGSEARRVTVGGMAKGSGMIHPNMATMLAYVALDLPVRVPALQELLRRAVDRSFHEITIDGDTSTNDTVLLLSLGEGETLELGDPRLEVVGDAVSRLCEHLAMQIVRDGEGMTRIMELQVHEARDPAAARAVADSIAGSSLVKTALAGGDPNWGRILAAAANAGVDLDPDALVLELGGLKVFAGGAPLPVDSEALDRAFSADRVRVDLWMGAGSARARRYTTDLSVGYVRINSEYTT